MKLHLAGLFALSTLSTSLFATDKFNTQLMPSETGDYIVKMNKNDQYLLNDLTVKTLNNDATTMTVLVSLNFEQAQSLSENTKIHYVEADNYQQFYTSPSSNSHGFTLADDHGATFDMTSKEIIKNLDSIEHTPYGISLVNADKVPEPSTANKTVCIIDSGLQADHDDFAGLPISGNDSDYSGFWDQDQVQHGTHVAGTVVAVENNSGVVGVIKNGQVNVYAQKLSNGGPGNGIRTSHTMEAMEVCANQGADVVSMSFGGPVPSYAVNDVIDRLTERGVLFVAAAGNHGRPRNCRGIPDDQVDRKRACENAHKAQHFPASYHNVMAVAAINKQSGKAAFSPQNEAIEVAAPGVNTLSTLAQEQTLFDMTLNGQNKKLAHIGNTGERVPNTAVMGEACGPTNCSGEQFVGKACLYPFRLPLTEPLENCAASGGAMFVLYLPFPGANDPLRGSFGVKYDLPVFSVGNDTATTLLQNPEAAMKFETYTTRHGFMSGTSMAAPHASGVAVKVMSLHPQCSNKEIRKVLQYTAKDLGLAGKDVKFGHGLVDTKAAHDYITQNGCEVPATSCPDDWYWNQAYTRGEKVSFNGEIFKAKWWSKQVTPDTSNAWELVGQCTN